MLPLFVRAALLAHISGAPMDHVDAAIAQESPDIPATLLLSQAYEESRYDRWVVSGVIDGRRRTGNRITSGRMPPGVSGPYFCGSTQLLARDSRACVRIARDLNTQYAGARDHLRRWLQFCARTGRPDDMVCALAGYGGGVRATHIHGRGWRYAHRILRRARSMRI